MLAAMDGPAESVSKPPVLRTVLATPVLLTVKPDVVPKSSILTKREHGLIHAVGAVSSHHDVGFTPYFDENIKALKAPIPLTIFNNDWKKRAIKAHITFRHVKSAEAERAYKGLAYASEWTQTHSDWTINHRNFYL
ncbi:hypothetical protein PTTG_06255, partial [Puccinia triticina 1-1 BBBD Race 1]